MLKHGVEFHQLNHQGSMYYPVRYHIQQNMPHIIEMSDVIAKIYGEKDIVLWCSGSSGAMIAAVIATRLKNVTVSHVKKDSEKSHSDHINLPSSYTTEPHYKHVIVDDFMCSGNTLNYIHSKFTEKYPHLNIDALVVSGTVRMDRLTFLPRTIVCGCLRGPSTES